MAYIGVIRTTPYRVVFSSPCCACWVNATFSKAVQRDSAAGFRCCAIEIGRTTARSRRSLPAVTGDGSAPWTGRLPVTPPGVVLAHPTIRDHGRVTRGQAPQR